MIFIAQCRFCFSYHDNLFKAFASPTGKLQIISHSPRNRLWAKSSTLNRLPIQIPWNSSQAFEKALCYIPVWNWLFKKRRFQQPSRLHASRMLHFMVFKCIGKQLRWFGILITLSLYESSSSLAYTCEFKIASLGLFVFWPVSKCPDNRFWNTLLQILA